MSGANRESVVARQVGATTLLLQRCADGSIAARNDLHRHIYERLRVMAQKELARFGKVQQFFDADDVQQEVHARIDSVLQEQPPENSPSLWKLISLVIPQVLIDLHRKCARRPIVLENELGAQPDGSGGLARVEPGTVGSDPANLAEWTEFHDRALRLPEPQGTVFRLVWYHAMPRPEVAALMQVTERTVFNYFRAALDQLRPYAPLP
jgi:RNA polymerase sigma factor (sigma-70 family)